jgi:dihydropteroate synthase
MDKSTSFSLNGAGWQIDLSTPAVMGILNITPDSFYDGGKYTGRDALLRQAEKMLAEGAAILDLGAASSRPGTEEVPEDEELERLIPAVENLLSVFPDAIISVDTYRSKVAKSAVEAGAHIINDISGGTFDDKMFQTVADLNVPYVLMHIKGTPQNMQNNPRYVDVVQEVKYFFKRQLRKLRDAGVTKNIILDPGFGFGKTLENNYELLKDLASFTDLGCPVLTGISRKSMINKVLHITPDEALNGTTVLNTIALLNGANILRVHDVKEAVEVVRLVEFYGGVG